MLKLEELNACGQLPDDELDAWLETFGEGNWEDRRDWIKELSNATKGDEINDTPF